MEMFSKYVCLCSLVFSKFFIYTQITNIFEHAHSNFFPFSFLRSVAYREFTRMVYGILGERRVPLPACAYHQIRKTFRVGKGEEHSGFEAGDEEI